MIPERYTSACLFENKELHIDTSNGDYIWIINGEIIEQGCDPELHPNPEIREFASEIETI